MYNVLVTGCGGDIGQSICKILKKYPWVRSITGCDIHDNHPAKFMCDQFHILPRCTSPDYFTALEKVINNAAVDFMISASEPELRFFLAKKVDRSIFGKPIIMVNQKALEIGFDKLETAKFLEQLGLPFPKTEVIRDVRSPLFPAILKSKNGSGSKQVLVLENDDDFNFYRKKYPDFIMQEHVGKESSEYTCGLFRSKSGVCRNIIFKRTLTGGFSNFGIVEFNSSISSLLDHIALNLGLIGSINVQLRLSDKGPVVFEINPRFSSTVLFRELLGFSDLLWSIEDTLNLPLSDYTTVSEGRKFYKGYQEYYE